MIPVETFLAFLAAAAVFAYMPGPAMLYVAAQTVARSRAAGLMATLGVHLGGYVHVFAAAGGLSALFLAVPVLYTIVKTVGALYLVWLGIQMIRRSGGAAGDLTVKPLAGPRRAFIDSITVEILNPKTAMFFIAFLPQFTDPTSSTAIWLQLLVLGTIVNAMFSSADLVCVLLAGAVVARLKKSGRTQKWAHRVGGGILIGLGAHLALHRS